MRARRWLLFTAAGLVGVVVATGVGRVFWRADAARQPHVATAVPYLDTAVAAVVTGAGDDAAVAVAGVVRSSICRVGALRHEGGVYMRAADLFTDPGHEDALIGRIGRALPTGFGARIEQPAGAAVRSLTANAGHGVTVRVSRLGDGWVTVRALTGCTMTSDTVGESSDSVDAVPAQAIRSLLAALRTETAQTHTYAVKGVVTAVGISRPTDSARLAVRLRALVPAQARVFTATSANRLAYRDGPVSVVVAASDDSTAVTVRYTSANR